MPTLEELLKISGSLVVIVGALGAAVVFLRGSLYKGAIAALQATVEAQDDRINNLVDENHALKEKDLSKSETINHLMRENALLLAQRPSADAIADIAANLREHHKEVISLLKDK